MSSEVAAREAADASLATKIDSDMSSEKASARVAADGSLEAKIDSDMSNEVAAREAADVSLATKIDSDVSSEASLRVAGDEALTAKINSDVSSEASSRVAADATLQSNIDVEKGRIDAILSGASIDLDQFKEIVSFVEEVDLENDNALLAAVSSINTASAMRFFQRSLSTLG